MKKIPVLLLTFLALPAYAEGNFVGVNFASTFGYPNSTETIPGAVIAAGGSSASAQQRAGSLGAGIYFGRWYSENFGSELGYNYLGGGIDGSFSAPPLSGTYNYSASALHWALLAGAPLQRGKIFGKIGFYSANTKSEWAITGKTSSSSSNGNLGLLLGLGIEEPISEKLSSRFGVDLFNGVKFQDVAYGASVNQTMFRISFGLNYKY